MEIIAKFITIVAGVLIGEWIARRIDRNGSDPYHDK